MENKETNNEKKIEIISDEKFGFEPNAKLEVVTKAEESPKMDIAHPDFLRPERLEGENDKQYKIRRIFNKMYLKHRKKGQMMWISKDAKQPVFAENDTEMKGKPIGYQVSKGFTYNKKQVQKALEKYTKEKQELEILKKVEETNQITIK